MRGDGNRKDRGMRWELTSENWDDMMGACIARGACAPAYVGTGKGWENHEGHEVGTRIRGGGRGN